MSFLTPLFLIGGLAIAGPILFHLIRRTTKDHESFSSLMFLRPTPPRVTRRSRLENIFLLLVRCLALALLALAFARPFFSQPVDINGSDASMRKTVLVVDASASMRRGDLWQQAVDRAEKVLKDAGHNERVAMLTFDRNVETLLGFEEWSLLAPGDRAALALSKLSAHKPSWGGSALADALVAAVDLLEDADAMDSELQFRGTRRVVLVSDLQQGADLAALQAYEWPKGVELDVESLKQKRLSNAGIQVVQNLSEKALTDADNAGPRVRVSNAEDSQKEQFHVGWVKPGSDDFIGEPADAYVPPGQSRVIAAPKPPEGIAGAHLRLAGDDETFDNDAWYAPPATRQTDVVFLGPDEKVADPEQLLFYVNRAFQETRLETVKVIEAAAGASDFQAQLDRAKLLILTGKGSADQFAAARKYLEAGSTGLLVLADKDATRPLREWFLISQPLAEEGRVRDYAMFGGLDFTHPLLSPFADPRFSDFTKIRFWHYRKLDASLLPGAKVVASFDSGDPALLEVPLGKGRLFVLASGWQPADSQFALSSKFVPLLYSLLEISGGSGEQANLFAVGDPIPLDRPDGKAASILTPDGTVIPAPESGAFTGTTEPGIYTVTIGTEAHRLAVNLDPAESRTAPLTPDELGISGAPLGDDQPTPEELAEQKRHLLKSQLENRQKIWKWLIVATLLVLILETGLAGRITKHVPAAEK